MLDGLFVNRRVRLNPNFLLDHLHSREATAPAKCLTTDPIQKNRAATGIIPVGIHEPVMAADDAVPPFAV
jgi:hypothetical protein